MNGRSREQGAQIESLNYKLMPVVEIPLFYTVHGDAILMGCEGQSKTEDMNEGPVGRDQHTSTSINLSHPTAVCLSA